MASSYPARGKSRGYVPPEEKKAKGSAGRWIGVIVALLVFGLLGAWATGLFGRRTDVRIVEIRKMSDEMSKQMATGGPQNEDEAKAFAQSMGQIREKIQALPEDLRGQAFRGGGMGRGFQAAMQANMKSFFSTPPAKREAELDRQIKREQMMQKAFAAAGGFGGGPGWAGWWWWWPRWRRRWWWWWWWARPRWRWRWRSWWGRPGGRPWWRQSGGLAEADARQHEPFAAGAIY